MPHRAYTLRPPVASLMIVLVIIGLSLAVIWPTLTNHWQLLDDGVTLSSAQHLQKNWSSILESANNNGRFMPAYVAYYALLYKFFGTDPRGYYAAQAVILILSSLLIYAIIRLLTRKSILGLLGVLIFLFSSAIGESYYTISKAEPRMVLFLLASLYFYLRADFVMGQTDSNSTDHRFARLESAACVIASGACLVLAYFSKETAVILLPASFFWVVAVFCLQPHEKQRKGVGAALGYFVINVLAFAIFALVAYVWAGTPLPWQGSYTSQLSFIPSLDNFLLYKKGSLDILLLTGLSCAGILVWLISHHRSLSRTSSYTSLFFLFAGAYFCLFNFFWRGFSIYYLLPVAAFIAIAVCLLTKIVAVDQRSGRLRTFTFVFVALVLVLVFAYSIPTLYNTASALKIWDRVNAQMLTWSASVPRDTVFFLNSPNDFEYNYEMQVLLPLLYERSDVGVRSLYSPQDLLQYAKPGDIILVNFGREANPYIISARMVHDIGSLKLTQSWISGSMADLQLEDIFRTESERLTVQPLTFHPAIFGLGWAAYRIITPPSAILNKYADGWIGPEADLWLRGDILPATVVLSGRSFLPDAIDYPINLEVWLGQSLVEPLTIESPGNFSLSFLIKESSGGHEGVIDLKLVSDKSFVPARYYASPDTRELSIIVDTITVEEVKR